MDETNRFDNYNEPPRFQNLPPIGGGNETIPNSTGVLIMGIISVAMCWCYGFIGITLGIISIILSKKAMELYESDPGRFSESSLKNLKAGKILAIIGLIISILFIIMMILSIVLQGVGSLTNFGKYY